eukprot:TRINITY_DN3981_c0_g2_i1.p1 TRINITY_DN3981_c0_g2~~TRINITY_DN3981_c0_g2_i1.p1  ORF type:complete len:674 (+),score=179.35 TRINITY_DN3981_c0_g2_i1:212-2233(+)
MDDQFAELEGLLFDNSTPAPPNNQFGALPLQTPIINPSNPHSNMPNATMRLPTQNMTGINPKIPQQNVPNMQNRMQNQQIPNNLQKISMQNQQQMQSNQQQMQLNQQQNQQQQQLNRNALAGMNPANNNNKLQGPPFVQNQVRPAVMNGLPLKSSAIPVQNGVGQQSVKQSIGNAPLRPNVQQPAQQGRMQTPEEIEARKRNTMIAVTHFETVAHLLPEPKQTMAVEELKKFRNGTTTFEQLFKLLRSEIYGEVAYQQELARIPRFANNKNQAQAQPQQKVQPGQTVNNVHNNASAAVKASGVPNTGLPTNTSQINGHLNAAEAQKLLKNPNLPNQTMGNLPLQQGNQVRPANNPPMATPINGQLPAKKVTGMAPKMSIPPVKGSSNPVGTMAARPGQLPSQSASTIVPPLSGNLVRKPENLLSGESKTGVDLTKENEPREEPSLFNKVLLNRKIEETVRKSSPGMEINPEIAKIVFQAAQVYLKSKISELEKAARIRMDETKLQHPVVYTNNPKADLELIERNRLESEKRVIPKEEINTSEPAVLNDFERQVNNMNNAASQALMNTKTPTPFKPVPHLLQQKVETPPPSLTAAELDRLQIMHRNKLKGIIIEQKLYDELLAKHNAHTKWKSANARRITLKDINNSKRVIDPESPLIWKCEINRLKKRSKPNA